MENQWSKLDNAGKIYPANVNFRNTTLFRLWVSIKDDVAPEILQRAVNEIMSRFPYYHVKLKRGFFWYYFIKTDEPVIIKEDLYYPCTEWDFKKKGFMFLVRYKQREIAVEFSHSITDGTGAIEFFKALLLQYFRLRGIEPEDTMGIKQPGEAVEAGEDSDAFREFCNMHIPASMKRREKALHLNYHPTKRGVYHITSGNMDIGEMKRLSEKKGIGITPLLCLFYFQIFQQIAYERKATPLPIVINLPVNLRRVFNSNTMYNFFVSITPKIDLRLGFFSEEDIIKHINNYISLEIDRRYVGKMIKRNIITEQNIFIRIIPLFLKELLLPLIYRLWGERGYTSGISNLGKIEFPHELEAEIESFHIAPPPSPGNLVKMLSYSYKDRFYVTFGSLTEDKTVEKKFFRMLRKNGVSVKIEQLA